MSPNKDWTRCLVMDQIEYAKRNGLKIVLPPTLAEAARREGIWDDDVIVVQQPLPTE